METLKTKKQIESIINSVWKIERIEIELCNDENVITVNLNIYIPEQKHPTESIAIVDYIETEKKGIKQMEKVYNTVCEMIECEILKVNNI